MELSNHPNQIAMKRILFFLLTVHCSLLTLFSQAPQGFNYQAVVRDDAGTVVSDQVVGMKISILKGSVSGTVVYSETHAPTTNSFGLVTLSIGSGTTSDDFSAIDWGGDLYFLKVEMDASGGTSYSEMGTTQLLSVPYALFAAETANTDDADANPENELQDLSLSGNTLSLTGDATSVNLASYLDDTNHWSKMGDVIYYNTGNVGIGTDAPIGRLEVKGNLSGEGSDPLFEVKRNDGQTVFAVYPDSVRIYVNEEETKGTKGGFAVGGFTPATKGLTNEFLRVTPDSVRMYINDETTKGTKGGFAVGGFTPGKGITNDFLSITPDSTRVFTKDTISGFAIGNIETGNVTNYLHLTPKNYFIGHESGKSMVDGLYNIFIGYQSGYSTLGTDLFDWHGSNNSFIGYKSGFSNTYGHKNIFIGNESGYSNTTGYDNVFIGARSGYTNTTGADNIFIGKGSGESNTSGAHNFFAGSQCGTKNTEGDNNAFIGHYAGYLNTTGSNNINMGYGTAFYNTTGSDNIYIGHQVAWNATTGSGNTFLGSGTGYSNTSGYSNTYIGYRTGYVNSVGHHNVFIGNQAGSAETGSNKLYIDNTSTSAPLIYGDFSSNYLRFNGNVGISVTPAYTLDVNGILNIRRNGVPALYISGYEAIWCNGTYFSWGFGGAYNAFADKVSIGTTNTSGYMLYVYGSAYTTGSWLGSDARLKDDFLEIEQPLEKVLSMQGVNYRWKTDEYPDRNFPEGRHYGVIAQDIENVLPEIVMEHNGEKAVAYTEIIPVLIEAMKEQQNLIEKQQTEIDELKKMVMELMGRDEW